jgi:spermidine synthase
MFNFFVKTSNFSAKTVGRIYGINTFGAMAGVIFVPFVFLNYMSIQQTLWFVSFLNIGAGIVILWLGFLHRSDGTEASLTDETNGECKEEFSFGQLIVISTLTGVMTIAVELSMIRHSFAIVPSSPYNFGFVLAPVLFAMGLGSHFWPNFIEKANGSILEKIGYLLIAAPIAFLCSVWLSDFTASLLSDNVRQNFIVAMIYFSFMTIPFFFILGGIFPLLCRISASTAIDLPNRTGSLYLYNSLGAFFGAILIQFLGFKYLGTPVVISCVVILCSSYGGWLISQGHRFNYRVFSALIPCLLLALIYNTDIWNSYVSGRLALNDQVTTRVEGQTGTAEIVWDQSGVSEGMLYVGGQDMGRVPTQPKTTMQISAAMSISGGKRILVLGLGAGGYLRELVKEPSIKSIDVVDWSHELPELLQLPVVTRKLGNPFLDSRVTLHSGDARLAVSLFPAHRFDVVIDNLTYPTWVGATGIRSLSYYSDIARILSSDGTYVLTTNYAKWRKEILAGLKQTFPSVNENVAAHVVFSSWKPAVIDLNVVSMISTKNAVDGDMTVDEMKSVLVDGFVTIEIAELKGFEPIVDNELFTEYYIQPIELMLRAMRIFGCWMSGKELDTCKRDTRHLVS